MPESCAKVAAGFWDKGESLPTNFADVVRNKPANIQTYHAHCGNLTSGMFEELSEERGQGIQGCDCSSGEVSARHKEPLRPDTTGRMFYPLPCANWYPCDTEHA